jgi:hypothetical protein
LLNAIRETIFFKPGIFKLSAMITADPHEWDNFALSRSF